MFDRIVYNHEWFEELYNRLDIQISMYSYAIQELKKVESYTNGDYSPVTKQLIHDLDNLQDWTQVLKECMMDYDDDMLSQLQTIQQNFEELMKQSKQVF